MVGNISVSNKGVILNRSASTKPTWQLNGEIKRRSNIADNFTNDTAVIRLVGALMGGQNDEYVVYRRYMTLEGFKPASDDPLTKLPAVPA